MIQLKVQYASILFEIISLWFIFRSILKHCATLKDNSLCKNNFFQQHYYFKLDKIRWTFSARNKVYFLKPNNILFKVKNVTWKYYLSTDSLPEIYTVLFLFLTDPSQYQIAAQ